MKKFALLLINFWAWSTFATIFVPINLDQQLKEADGVVHGTFAGSVSKKLPNGEIVTENTFKLINKSGIAAGEIINEYNFKVLSPGGTWQGMVYHIEGSPTFTKGEEVILLLQNGKFGLEIYGLGMGKYKIKKEDRETTIYSSVFPNHKKLGNISISEFNMALKKAYGEPFQRLKGKRYVYQKENPKRDLASLDKPEKKGRDISSLDEEEEEFGDQAAPLGGVFFFFLMAYGIVYFLNKR